METTHVALVHVLAGEYSPIALVHLFAALEDEQGESDGLQALVDEAYALYARVNKARSGYLPGSARRVRLGRLRYRTWKRWMRRKAA